MTTDAPPSLALDLAEAAALLGISYRTAKEIIARNRAGERSSLGDGIPAVKVGGKWKVARRPVLEAFGEVSS